jgi:hypothetical protein
MADCEVTERCIFFNDRMTNMPSMEDVYKKQLLQRQLERMRPVHGLHATRQGSCAW